MPLTVRCPHCSTEFTAGDELAGRTIPCPNCDGVVAIPGAASPAMARPVRATPPPEPAARRPRVDEEDDRPTPRRPARRDEENDNDTPRRRPEKKKSPLPLILGGVGLVLLLGCGLCGGVGYWLTSKAKTAVKDLEAKVEAEQAKVEANAKAAAATPGVRPPEQPPAATLPVKDLKDRGREFDGKWVAAVGRVQRVSHTQFNGKPEQGTLTLAGSMRTTLSCDFGPDEWAVLPKFDDAREYKVLGLYSGGTFGALKWCRVLDAPSDAGRATVTAAALAKDPAKYKGRTVFVTGTVNKADPMAKTVTLDGDDARGVVAPLGDAFARVLKNGRGGTVELRAKVGEAEDHAVPLTDCDVISERYEAPPLRARVFAQRFAKPGAEASAKGKKYIIQGTVESVSPDGTRVVIAGDAPAKSKVNYTIAARFGPEWKDAVAALKPGADVKVSGEFTEVSGKELVLTDCWVLPPG